ncbi:TIGR02757 family protein [Mangrovimonas sp. AS39]|uniref:TIGR02757 family protein n=1 Tax=Mangrovimonas futianensis TaxID=2895523 RepID=UPI001E2854D2|nr:TIGR02757 family protein [Mangrovimonas futianensis]MCF1191656.1 TIGR02757 family protein [Mangrovimonas futianensis]MCF1195456.1 TIGR02757 family protein [Mangrovimonas futianensis]
MTKKELKEFLDQKAALYNNTDFISTDPIQIPHQFSLKEDIEIASFLTASIAWGNRKSIITNAKKLMLLLDESPYDFIMNHEDSDLDKMQSFVHRTFNGLDLITFIKGLKHIYSNHAGLEGIFNKYQEKDSLQFAIHKLKEHIFEIEHLPRTQKHVSDPLKNSAAKRINMFLRWMVRPNNTGVDFGLWQHISTSKLSMPLDVHTGNIGRKLGLLIRKQNDAKALKELDQALRKFDPMDPVKYDFALFGLGAFEKF